MKFLKSTVTTFITNIFIFLISIVTTIITSRMLGTTGKGILGIANNLITFSILILGFGIESSNIYFLGKNKNDINKVLGSNVFNVILSGIIMVIVFFLNKYKLLPINIFKGLDVKITIVVLITIPFTLLKSYLINVVLGLQEVGVYNKLNILDRIFNFVFLIIFITIYRMPFWVILSNFIALCLLNLILIMILIKKFHFKVDFDKLTYKHILKYGIKNEIGNIIQFMNYRLDIFIIVAYKTIDQVGIYSNAVALAETIWQVAGSVSTIVFPMTSSSKDKNETAKFVNKIVRITLLIVIICSICIVVFSRPVILMLFGKSFLPSADALILLMPGISIFSVSKILSSYIAGIGKIEKNIIASSVSCIVTVVLDFILIPKIGINGASIATSISYTVFTIIIIYFYIDITKSKILDLLVLKKEDIIEIKQKILDIKNSLTSNIKEK